MSSTEGESLNKGLDKFRISERIKAAQKEKEQQEKEGKPNTLAHLVDDDRELTTMPSASVNRG
jgi:hypothetical protein